MAIRKIQARSISDGSIDIQTDSIANTRNTVRPSLLLDFANSQSFDSRVTFTRNSTATYTGVDGYIKTADVNQPRIDFDPITKECKGFLSEESRTNLVPSMSATNQSGNAGWTQSRGFIATDVYARAPDGSYGAQFYLEDTQNGPHYFSYTLNGTAGSTYTFSCYMKAGSRTFGTIGIEQQTSGSTYLGSSLINVNLTTGAFTNTSGGTPPTLVSSGVTNVGNGWYRISITATLSTSVVSFRTMIYPSTALETLSWQGDGGSGVYIWGAQLELATFATSYIPAPVTFVARASTATYVDQYGIIRQAAVDKPRYSYNFDGQTWFSRGLHLEGQSTNLFTYSEQLDNASWTKANSTTISANSVAAPDATTTADTIVGTLAASQIYKALSKASSALPYTLSVYIKPTNGATGTISLALSDNATGQSQAFFNIVTGAISDVTNGSWAYTTAKATPMANGWWRFSLNSTSPANGGLLPTVTVGAKSVYAWGMQVEQTQFATSYIPTTAAAVTRSADLYRASTSNTRQEDYAYIDLGYALKNRNAPLTVNFRGDVIGIRYASRLYEIQFDNAGNSWRPLVDVNGSLNIFTSYGATAHAAGTITANTEFKNCVSLTDARIYSAINGVAASSSTSTITTNLPTTPALSAQRLVIGNSATGDGPRALSGHVKTLAIYETALSDSEAIALTA